MNHAVFLGLLSGEPLFTNTFVLFGRPKVNTKPPQKNQTKTNPKAIKQNLTDPSKLTDLIHGTM